MKSYSQTVSLSGRRQKKLPKTGRKNASPNYKKIERIINSISSLVILYISLEDFSGGMRVYHHAIELLHQLPNFEKFRSLAIELYGKIITMAPEEAKAYVELSEEYLVADKKNRPSDFSCHQLRKRMSDRIMN